MNHSLLTGTRKHLVNQLVYFDEQISNFLETYFPQQSQDRAFMERHIKRYKDMLEHALEQDDDTLVQLLNRTALVGSSIKIKYSEDGSEETFHVVFPAEIDPDQNRISFLSPIGRQLLLTSAGDCLTLQTPASSHDIQIEGVKLNSFGTIALD